MKPFGDIEHERIVAQEELFIIAGDKNFRFDTQLIVVK